MACRISDKSTDKPYILMVEGKHLHHPLLEKGKRARMKILRIDPGKDLPVETILECSTKSWISIKMELFSLSSQVYISILHFKSSEMYRFAMVRPERSMSSDQDQIAVC